MLCNQPKAFASNLGDDQSLYLSGTGCTRESAVKRFVCVSERIIVCGS